MIDDEQLASRLLEAGLIDRDKLRAGQRLTETVGTSLYETLSLHKLVDEAKLVALVAEMLNVRAIRIDDATIDEAVLGLVPVSLATRNRVIPLDLQQEGGHEQLVLGMADPIDVLAMDEIATHTGIDIRPVLVAPAQLSRALDRFYGQSDTLDADALFADFDLDLDELQVGGDDSWAEYFDQAQKEELEDSALISQEMRDRPSTDVLAVDEFGEIEVVDESQTDEPLDEAFEARADRREIDLDDWEIDEAIGGDREAQILSKHDAEELFATASASDAQEDEEQGEESSGLSETTADVVDAARSPHGLSTSLPNRLPKGISEDSAFGSDSEPEDDAPAAPTASGAEPHTRELDAPNLRELTDFARDHRGSEAHNRETAQHRALPRELRGARASAPDAGALGMEGGADPMAALAELPTEALLRAALRMLVEHGLLDPAELAARARREAGGDEG